MSGMMIALIGFGIMLVLIALRAPIGFAMLLVGAAGYMHLSSGHAFFAYMKTNAYQQFANYTLSVIPLFILMGALAERAGIAASLFKCKRTTTGATTPFATASCSPTSTNTSPSPPPRSQA